MELLDMPEFRIRETVEEYLGRGVGLNDLETMLRESIDGMISIATVIKKFWVVGGTVPKKIDIDIIKAVGKVLSESPKLKVSPSGLRVGLVKPVPIYFSEADSVVAYPFDDAVDLTRVFRFFANRTNNQIASAMFLEDVDGEQFKKAALIEFKRRELASSILGEKVEFEGAVLEMKSKVDFDALMDRQEVNPKKMVTFKLELLSEFFEVDVSRNDVLMVFQDFGSIRKSNFDPISKCGWILFREEGPAKLAVEAIEDDGGLGLKNYIISLESEPSLKRTAAEMPKGGERMTKVTRNG